MATAAQADSGGIFHWLDRSHTVAKPGFSRWLVPPAALCVHLCIGQVYAFSVFNLPMTRLIGDHRIRAGRLEAHRARLDLLHRHRVPRPRRRLRRHLGRAGRPAQGDVHRSTLLRRRLPRLRARRASAPALARLSRLWRARRLRPRPRLHLAGQDADQLVPRPAGHGDRHGDHGLRRRRLHRLAAVGLADAAIRDPDPCRRDGDLRRAGHRLLRLHDGRRGDRARAAEGWAPEGYVRAEAAEGARHHAPTSMSTRR